VEDGNGKQEGTEEVPWQGKKKDWQVVTMANGQFKMTGTEIPLGKGPTGAPFANPGNKGSFQITGDSIELGRSSVQSPSANPKEGTRQDGQASKIALSRTPVKKISSPDTLPFSDRAHEQSQTA